MVIHPHQKRWANDFNQIKQVINAILSTLNVHIHHIGSTSVKDLAAKPIIDIDISYDENVAFEDVKNGLEKLGYYHNGDQGIKDREAFKRGKSNQKHPILDTIRHHLYVCPPHSEELKRHIAFRDYLAEHEEARKAYENIKYKIAEETNQDKRRYADMKEIKARAFIEGILKKANS